MSNLIINWRFWLWHLQVVQPDDWGPYRRAGRPIVRWSRNAFRHPLGSLLPPIAIYEGWRYFLGLIVLLNLLLWWAL